MLAGQHDDRKPRSSFHDPLDRLSALAVGKPPVGDDEIRRVLLQDPETSRQGFLAAELDLVVAVPKDLLEQASVPGIVLN